MRCCRCTSNNILGLKPKEIAAQLSHCSALVTPVPRFTGFGTQQLLFCLWVDHTWHRLDKRHKNASVVHTITRLPNFLLCLDSWLLSCSLLVRFYRVSTSLPKRNSETKFGSTTVVLQADWPVIRDTPAWNPYRFSYQSCTPPGRKTVLDCKTGILNTTAGHPAAHTNPVVMQKGSNVTENQELKLNYRHDQKRWYAVMLVEWQNATLVSTRCPLKELSAQTVDDFCEYQTNIDAYNN